MKKVHLLFAAFLLAAMLPACAPAEVDCASKAVFCVGLVTDVGKVTDKAFNQEAWEGVQQAQKQWGAQVEYIETVNSKDVSKNISAFGEENYDVIVTVGFDLADATSAAAALYPDTDFIGVDQLQTKPVEGVAGLNFHEDQAGFLAGALAAMMSKNHQIGAVCPADGIPSVWRLGEGYKAGAAYVDEPDQTTSTVYVAYDNNSNESFLDPEWGAKTASTMLNQGADVVFNCGGATGEAAITAAAQSGAYVIGLNTDQYLTLPKVAPHMISSAIKLITPGVFELIKLSREGAFPSGNYFGQVGYAPFHDLENVVPAEVRTEMEKITTGLQDGSIKTNIPVEKP